MSNIIKRRKTSQYLQLNNFPVQKDLGDLQAIGLLTYLMSLPEDWEIHKTELYSRFSERRVAAAWKILAEKGYIIGFTCYIGKVKTYYYNVSDIRFTKEEYDEWIEEELQDLVDSETKFTNVSEIPFNIHKITTRRFAEYLKNEVSTTRQNVEYKMKSTNCSPQNVDIQNKYKQNTHKQININKKNNINNIEEERAVAHVNTYYFNEFKETYSEIISQEMFDKIYIEMQLQGIEWFTTEEASRQIKRMNKKGRDEIFDWAKYFVGGIIKNRISKEQVLSERKIKKAALMSGPTEQKSSSPAPFYNWLES